MFPAKVFLDSYEVTKSKARASGTRTPFSLPPLIPSSVVSIEPCATAGSDLEVPSSDIGILPPVRSFRFWGR
ncbi:hypothetical protein LXL04_035243 [Taraxacum kok-saghyz]